MKFSNRTELKMLEKEKLPQLHSGLNDYNLPFQGVMNTIFTLTPRLRRWAEITFGLQPIFKTKNIHGLKAQINSAQWQRLGE